MKRSDSGKGRRRKALPLAVLGLALGAALAYALVAWRRALLPEIQLLPPAEDEGVSVYEVTGEDASTEWTDASLGDLPAVPDDNALGGAVAKPRRTAQET
jgi:hypothetical protein